MAALTTERLRHARQGTRVNGPVKAATQIYRGGLVASVAGVLVPARAAVSRAELDTLRILGLATDSVLGGAADGDLRLDIEVGVYRFASGAGADALTFADVGSLCFAMDDQTVGKTTGGGARAIAGRIVDVDADGVWVDTEEYFSVRRVRMPFFINETDVLAHTAAELISPVAGAISLLDVTVQKAVTTGGLVTVNVGAGAGVAVAGLGPNVANAAAKGTIVTGLPTIGDATTVVTEGARLQVIPANTFATAGAISGFVEITF